MNNSEPATTSLLPRPSLCLQLNAHLGPKTEADLAPVAKASKKPAEKVG